MKQEQKFKIGQLVAFRSEFVQAGRVAEIHGGWLILEALSPRGFAGAYIGGQRRARVRSTDCWL